jgi:phosphomannomutase
VTFIKVHHQPDGNFPNGIPNPLLPECRQDTADAVREHADMGIAFDGDFDRAFLITMQNLSRVLYCRPAGGSVPAEAAGRENHSRPAPDVEYGGYGDPQRRRTVMSKTGHAFIKERMRQEDAIYGGEMSAHHYFRDFAYCDSGMIPWLLVAELLCLKNSSLKALVADRQAAFPASGEINRKLECGGGDCAHP